MLDVAAGSGNAAIPAALAGVYVVARDLNRELLKAGRDRSGWAWSCSGFRTWATSPFGVRITRMRGRATRRHYL